MPGLYVLYAVCAIALLSVGGEAAPVSRETMNYSVNESVVGVARSTFAPAGTVYVTTAYIHVSFTVNMTIMNSYCDLLARTIDEANRCGAFSDADSDELRLKVEEACQGLFRWEGQDVGDHLRVKRQAMAALGIVAGTLFGAFSLAQMSDMHDRIEYMEEQDLRELHLLQSQQLRIGTLEQDVVHLNESMTIFYKAFASFENTTRSRTMASHVLGLTNRFATKSLTVQRGIQALHGHRVSVDLITTQQAAKIWPQVLAKVQRRGGVAFPFPHATAMYQFPASFVIRDGVIRVFVHIPVIKRRLELYQHRSTPIVIKELEHTVVMELANEEAGAMLAVDRDTTVFVVLTTPEVSECLRIDQAFFCQLSVLRRDFTRSCMGALFINDRDGIQQHCRTILSDRTAFAFRIGREVHLYSQEATSVAINCHNGSRTAMRLEGHQQVWVEPGCQLTAQPFVVDGREVDETIDGGNVVHRMTASATTWCAGASVRRILEAQKTLREVQVHPAREVPALLQQLQEHERHHRHGELHILQHGLMGVGLLLVLGATSWAAWRCARRRHRRQELFQDLQVHVEKALKDAKDSSEAGDGEVKP